MSDKHVAAGKLRWSLVPRETRTEMMRVKGKRKWELMTPEQKQAAVDAMTQGRINKAAKRKNENGFNP